MLLGLAKNNYSISQVTISVHTTTHLKHYILINTVGAAFLIPLENKICQKLYQYSILPLVLYSMYH